jgi:hypothetical protein
MHLGSAAPLGRIVERFGDYRGYLYFYAFSGSLLSKGLIHPFRLGHRQESPHRG